VTFPDSLQTRKAYICGVERFDRRAAAGLVFVVLALFFTRRFVAAFLDARELFLTFLECSARSTCQGTPLLCGIRIYWRE
jgi:hypothetical protein